MLVISSQRPGGPYPASQAQHDPRISSNPTPNPTPGSDILTLEQANAPELMTRWGGGTGMGTDCLGLGRDEEHVLSTYVLLVSIVTPLCKLLSLSGLLNCKILCLHISLFPRALYGQTENVFGFVVLWQLPTCNMASIAQRSVLCKPCQAF
jgi:hypothetical protein